MRLYLALGVVCAGTLLAGCAPRAPVSGAAPTTGDGNAASAATEVGARIFNGSCASCHQPNGLGVPGAYPSLAGSPLVLGDLEPLAAWVIEGRRPPQWPAERYSTLMPKFGWLQDEDAAALFTYLRSHFGNAAPAVDAAAVARALRR